MVAMRGTSIAGWLLVAGLGVLTGCNALLGNSPPGDGEATGGSGLGGEAGATNSDGGTGGSGTGAESSGTGGEDNGSGASSNAGGSGGSTGGVQNGTGGSGGGVPVTCGDGDVDDDEGETCDDGEETDTCDDDCTAVDCGDGNENSAAGEDCDDNGVDTANCNADCTEVVCGDDYVNTAVEECEEGGETDTCDDDCTAVQCGDGTLNTTAGEVCDDNNYQSGDGCTQNCMPEVLILGDGVTEDDAVPALQAAGYDVVVAPVAESAYDGASPPPDAFCAVLQFDATDTVGMPTAGQAALVAYVNEGGGFLSTGPTAYEAENQSDLSTMSSLLLLDWSGDDNGIGQTFTLTSAAGTHPATENLWDVVHVTSGGEYGSCVPGATALARSTNADSYCAMEVGQGRVLSLGSYGAFNGGTGFQGIGGASLLTEAVDWLCGRGDHEYPSMKPGTTTIVAQGNYKAQCTMWMGDVCYQPSIALDGADVATPQCVDDTTSMRPFGGGTVGANLNAAAATWCWIATGDPTFDEVLPCNFSVEGTYGIPFHCMFVTSGSPDCDNNYGSHPSTVDVPVTGPQLWSFNDDSYASSCGLAMVTCNWR